MIFKKITHSIEDEEVLCLCNNKGHNYHKMMVGYIVTDEESSTGFACYNAFATMYDITHYIRLDDLLYDSTQTIPVDFLVKKLISDPYIDLCTFCHLRNKQCNQANCANTARDRVFAWLKEMSNGC